MATFPASTFSVLFHRIAVSIDTAFSAAARLFERLLGAIRALCASLLVSPRSYRVPFDRELAYDGPMAGAGMTRSWFVAQAPAPWSMSLRAYDRR